MVRVLPVGDRRDTDTAPLLPTESARDLCEAAEAALAMLRPDAGLRLDKGLRSLLLDGDADVASAALKRALMCADLLASDWPNSFSNTCGSRQQALFGRHTVKTSFVPSQLPPE